MKSSNSEELRNLIEKLDRSNYDEIGRLCDSTKKQADKLQQLEVHQATSQYEVLCNRMIEEVQFYIKNKKENFVPYIHTLFEKDESGHDCRNCGSTGSCGMRHEMQISEVIQSQIKLKDILNRLQMTSLPLYSETIYPDAYRILRNQMALLENRLTDVFFFEESYLLPKIVEAQKNIHVRS